MALDHTLARVCSARGILRLYGWSEPTLSFGRNEPVRGRYDPDRLRAEGVAVVRRPTGGRSVLHHREITYAVAAPVAALGGPRRAYETINRGLALGLSELGLPVLLAGNGPVAPLDGGACFRDPAPGEVMAQGRKLVGSAQVRMGRTLLQHGSLLIDDDQARITGLRSPPSGDGAPGELAELARPATLRELSGARVQVGVVEDALVRGLARSLAGDWPARWRTPPGEGSFQGGPDLPAPAPDLLDRYRSHAWTWRR